uniref:Uncharacterized protein n=1 Tax=Aegilops tauschii subsp. strangulata TaxID=200361 RepID=A0A453KGE3_AEGTS
AGERFRPCRLRSWYHHLPSWSKHPSISSHFTGGYPVYHGFVKGWSCTVRDLIVDREEHASTLAAKKRFLQPGHLAHNTCGLK